MLDTLDLSVRLDKADYKRRMESLGLELEYLQHEARTHGVPLLLLFEGWDAAGKGDSIATLVQHLDPRGFKVSVFATPTDEERFRPYPYRYSVRLPARGRIGIFNFSWYTTLLERRLVGKVGREAWEGDLQEAKEFEQHLADDGTVIVKFWLHISVNEQARRLKAWEADEAQRWRVGKSNWDRHKMYDKALALADEMLVRTHTHYAPWTLVAAEDDRHRRVAVLQATADAARAALVRLGVKPLSAEDVTKLAAAPSSKSRNGRPDPLPKSVVIPGGSLLARADLEAKLERGEYEKRLEELQEQLRELHFRCYAKRRAVIVVMEGWDAAGKGGAIKRLTVRMDPRGYEVIPIAAPTDEEKAHHYLWRFWRSVPKDGHLAVFDRSWYGRLLVERVEGFAKPGEWQRAFHEINDFERAQAEHGSILCKFWLHVSPEEQLRRFRSRELTPRKQHKITDEDWRNRAKWPEYLAAVTDMLAQTSTPWAPWTVVEANDKLWARIRVLDTVVRSIEAGLARKVPAGRVSV